MSSDADVRQNLENIIEEIAHLKIVQERDMLFLYGDSDIDVSGIKDRVKNLEVAMDTAIKNINGMPEQVSQVQVDFKTLQADVRSIIETDNKRVWIVRGIIAGIGLQSTGLLVVLAKIFS